MLRNYLLTAWRNLKRQKIFSAINVLGLSIGMAAGMLIVQYVQFELSYDDFHQQASRIYRLTSERYREGKLTSRSAQAAPQIGPLLQAQFPEVRRVALVAPWLGGVVTVSGSDGRPIAFNEKNVLFVDANFLRVFTHPLRSGTASALDQPNAVILTERSARKYFGSQNPLGKTLTFENHNQGHRYTVTVQGVCENGPANSHLPFDFLISRSVPGEAGGPSQWSAYTYVQLSPRGDAGKLAAKLNPFLEKHGKGSEASIERFRWGLQPLSAIHLYSDLSEDTKGNGNGKTIWLLAGVAGLILLIAYVNYINLSTVKSMERAKEVGIRKVLGSGRSHLVRLFFLESLLLNLLAFALALTLVQVSLPAFGRFIGVALSFTLWKSDWLWPGLGCLILGTLLSGLYPALVLSAYQPIQVLKGRMTTRRPGITLRKVLVVLQFTTCVALLIGTLTVYRQVNYMRSKDLGMNMAQTLIVAAPQTRRENLPEENQFNQRVNTFQTEVLRYPGVTGVTHASNVPGLEIDWTPRYFRTQNAPDEEAVYRPTMAIGPEFIDQFGIQLIAGEKFTPRQAQRM
ncbi:MAG: ABC transporter permease, partial [Ferruginibacter sp.]|nr:ABC transporter permease [Cytophagales bacterium]